MNLERREVPALFTVTSVADAGAGSLRQAISGANASAGVDTIAFDASFNAAKTITLTSGELGVTDGAVIKGPGSALLTISGNDLSRIFNVDAGIGKNQSFNLQGLTLAKGYVQFGEGGAVALEDETLTAIDVRFIANNVKGQDIAGGAVHGEAGGPMNFRDCAFAGNSAGGAGGAVAGDGGRNVTLLNCTLTDNTSGHHGGAVTLRSNDGSGNLSVTGCTFTGNTANFGGAISTSVSGDVFVADSLFADNHAVSGDGGAIHIYSFRTRPRSIS